MAFAACRKGGRDALRTPALRHLELLAHSCPSHRPHPTRYGWGLRSTPESYRSVLSGGVSGGTSPCSSVPCVLSVVGLLASVPSSPTSTSVALCWPPVGHSIWMLLGSLAAAAPSRATSKMPSW